MSIVAQAKDLGAKAITGFHRSLFRATKGRVGGRMFGMPVLILTTTGRKSGKRRQTMLTTPMVLGDSLVLVASYGGDPRHPTWYLNLRDNPDVEVTMQGSTRRMKARSATPEEKNGMWDDITAAYKGYGSYQKRTDRDIPVVVLDPA